MNDRYGTLRSVTGKLQTKHLIAVNLQLQCDLDATSIGQSQMGGNAACHRCI